MVFQPFVQGRAALRFLSRNPRMPAFVASEGKKSVDEALDRFRRAVGFQGLPNQPPLGREVRVFGQFNARGDIRGVERLRCKVGVNRVVRIEFGYRQRPNEIVKVARIALTDRLKVLDAVEHDAGVEHGGYISGFFE